jgi:DNA-binding FrmR family transcriptional regulator
MERGYSADRDAVLKRLRRVEGQVRGLQRMVEAAAAIEQIVQS